MTTAATLRAIPRGVWALGLVSMFMDVSSEMVHALLPVFLVSVLGAGTVAVGIIEGVAEATASITKIFSGALSDRLGKRKALAVAGYGLAALTKPIFPLASTVGWVMVARFLDRIGKGIRGAPRDALVADITPAHLRGASFGLRQSLDTIGAFAGPMLAMALMLWSGDDFRLVFWVAVVPAVLAVVVLVVGVHEPAPTGAATARPPLRLAEPRRLPAACWRLLGLAAVLGLARFGEAFLVLRAFEAGLAAAWAPLVLVAMNVVYMLTAYPAGAWSDRFGRHGMVAAGVAALLAADVLLAVAGGLWAVMAGVALWGLHMGLTQGLLAALVADAAPPALRGTAFGGFHFTAGVTALLASVAAGWLWQVYGAPATFAAGALVAVPALVGLLAAMRRPAA